MTQTLSVSSSISSTLWILTRGLLALIVFATLFLAVRRAIVVFTGRKSLQLGRKKYWYLGISLGTALLLALARRIVEALFTNLSKSLEKVATFLEPGWTGPALVGIYDTLLSTVILILAIQGTGIIYWAIEKRLTWWAQRQVTYPPTSLRRHMRRGFSLLNHAFRTTALVFLLLVFIPTVLRYFPKTQVFVQTIDNYMGNPARDILQAIVNYLPNLGYLILIIFMGWILSKLLKYVFDSLGDGSLTISGFLPEWAEPTYKLCRTLLYLFLLMVSYPYLPGSNSEFFKGFSVFVGALVTFGSSGAINNIVSGFVLTYTRAFRVGDMVKIGDVVGIVLEKTTLSTRIRTARNEEVTIPNGSVLTSTVTDYSARAATEGVALTVTAGIGYDADWRTVEALLIDAARRTENILADPAPIVFKSELGNYAVNYDLMAWTNKTDRADRLWRTGSELRSNVLDAFNAAGIEIMTPSIFAHRDASGLAIPPERFPERPLPRGIAVDINNTGKK